MKRKGFTLIELLAVIVILAVIALIATPIIMNAINSAKEGAAKDSAYSYMSALEYYVASTYNDDDPNNDFALEGTLSDTQMATLLSNVKVKGTQPDSLSGVVLSNGKVTSATIVVNGYTLNVEDGKVNDVDGSGSQQGGEQVVYTDAACFTFSEGTIINYGLFDQNGEFCPYNVVIPNTINGGTVKSIYMGAFSYKDLTSVTLPSTLETIGQNAFEGNKLTSITIPSSVTSIGREAFKFNQLTSITMSSSNVDIKDYWLDIDSQPHDISMLGGDTLNFENAYTSGGAGTYVGTQSGTWVKQ